MQQMMAQSAAEGAFVAPGLLQSLVSMALAFLLGGAVASRPWRRLLGMTPAPKEMFQAQILIAVAGSIAVIVIGNSLAIAFGLVGLGGFIRFRTGIRDPRDAAVFFLLIGIGMACGLGPASYGMALACAGFVALLLFGLDLTGRGETASFLRITANTQDPRGAAGTVREVIEKFPVKIRATNMKLQAGQIRFDLENPKKVAPAEIVDAVMSATEDALTTVTFEELATLRGSSL